MCGLISSSNRQPFKTLQGGMQMLMIRVMMILAVICTVMILGFAFWGDQP